MIELIVTPYGLRNGHDPHNPKVEDIVGTKRIVELADRVTVKTLHGDFVLKDRRPYVRVVFDGESIGVENPSIASPFDDEQIYKMRKELDRARNQ